MLFTRMSTDGRETDCSHLENSFCGASIAEAWIVGAGPSIKDAPCELIQNSPAPIITMNLAGRIEDGKEPAIKPDFWTSYDSTEKWPKSYFLDPRVMKFVNHNKRMDLVSGTTFKVCDSPNLYFYRNQHRGYSDILDPQSDMINNNRDSFIQCIDILFRLGFRRIYCVGCDMIVRPSDEQIKLAVKAGVDYDTTDGTVPHHTKTYRKKTGSVPQRSDQFIDFIEACKKAQLGQNETEMYKLLASVQREEQYSFTESKEVRAAVSSDCHYYKISQVLRLARKTFSQNGLELISCTPGSRLNNFFEYQDPQVVAERMFERVGRRLNEHSVGRYTEEHVRANEGFPLMQDTETEGWKDIVKREKAALENVPEKEEVPVAVKEQPLNQNNLENLSKRFAVINRLNPDVVEEL